ncbi:hypothetical protein AFC81_17690 [Mycobacterium avium subsp. paratuberculosis]|nr:hypothetical protein RE97_09180 [Mycobacterium avium subsp. paratuberculosis]OHW65737.1 hypothetical protein AFC81_17690 [Mycobacterium avium subsp. paratuberculosis]OHW66095.1 hypothetical protein AFC82_18160 [Mycobacterium avium subsp. paratuberculosis]OHW66751.1 hypothetical protein AFC79_17095 [Mycobacterium avium subsp. paratuberculosis]OHW77841.1 hypothetical protein AFC83_17740 [Mycobacterium avium subsp. paratuberculosis]
MGFPAGGRWAAPDIQDRAPASTAACTARAMRAPNVERGPPNASAAPSVGQCTTTASEAVPVARIPASCKACALASVAVATALTNAASDSRTGAATTMLIVPTRCGASRRKWWSGAAAQAGLESPTVAVTCTPPSAPRWWRVTSTAVNSPHPVPASPSAAPISTRWRWGSVRS